LSKDKQNKSDFPVSNAQLAKYSKSDWKRSTWQIINSMIPYFLLLCAMYISLDYSYWITLLLAIPAAGFMVRIFIIFHDCGHGSFFKSNRANAIVGYFSGLLVFAPYYEWRFNHSRHHATCSDLDRRGIGDVRTLTIKEYQALNQWNRFLYRLYRHPIIMFGLGPLYLFLINHRLTSKGARKREKRSVYLTNLGLLIIIFISGLTIGLKAYILIQFPIIFMGGMAGIWLFYVQHQFEDVYWARHENWDFYEAAIKGSSFYKLPKILQWFSGNIGYHHIHHLNARIPNYNLPACHEQIAEFKAVKPVTLWASLKSSKLRLWDEDNARMVGFYFPAKKTHQHPRSHK
jgi:omega-6 fatty acid desaturase (delta-12 desaturase)